MSKVTVNTTHTFEEWRVKTNEIGSGLGDIASLTQNALIEYTTPISGINDITFTGTPAAFKATINNKATPVPVYEITISSAGTGYAVNDTIKLLGSLVGGVDDIHDIIITVTEIGISGAVSMVTFTGTPTTDLVSELNLLRSEAGVEVLTTTIKTTSGAINELDALQGDTNIKVSKAANLPKSTFSTITDGLKQIDDFQGNNTLTTTATTTSAAINEHETDIGTMVFATSVADGSTVPGALVIAAGNHVVLGSTITSGLNATKARTDFLLDQLGGSVAADYNGPEVTVISAFNALHGLSNAASLDNTYLKRSGINSMLGQLKLHENGIIAVTDVTTTDAAGVVTITPTFWPLVFHAGSATSNERMRIETNGRIGIGKSSGINYKLDVAGDIAGTKLRYGIEDTDDRYLRITAGTAQTVVNDITFSGVGTFSKELIIGTEKVFDSTITTGHTITEWVQDVIGGAFTDNSLVGGITSTYSDSTGKISLSITNNAHNHISANITDLSENVQDIVGLMVATANTQSGITVSYTDNDASAGILSFAVANPKLSISGHATGDSVMTDLGDTDIDITIKDEVIEDMVGAMVAVDANAPDTGITVTYNSNDTTVNNVVTEGRGKLNFELTANPAIKLLGDVTSVTATDDTVAASVTLDNLKSETFSIHTKVADNSHNHTASNISDFEDSVQLIGKSLVEGAQESGISVSYIPKVVSTNSSTGVVTTTEAYYGFDVNDPVFTFNGAFVLAPYITLQDGTNLTLPEGDIGKMSNLGDTIFTTTLNTNIIEETHLKYNSSTPTTQQTGTSGQHLLSDGAAGFKWADVPTPPTYTGGSNISISSSNVITGTDTNTTYSEGTNISISSGNVISAIDTDTTYSEGTNISISSSNVISATSTQQLTAAEVKSFHESASKVSITNGTISTTTSNNIHLKASSSKQIKFDIGTTNVMKQVINVVGRPSVGIGFSATQANPIDVLELVGRLVVHPDLTQLATEGGEINIKRGTSEFDGSVNSDGWSIDEANGTFRVFSNSNNNSGGANANFNNINGRPATQKLRIDGHGRFHAIGAYEWTTTAGANVNVNSSGLFQVVASTRRVKKNIETMQDSYADAVLDIRPVWYRSKLEGDNPDWGYWGFIAEEVAKIDPRLAVFETHHLVEDVKEGSTRPHQKLVEHDTPIIQSVQYDRMIPHLVNLAKRQRDAIQDLTARLEALESK
jgi:hypothetical protein